MNIYHVSIIGNKEGIYICPETGEALFTDEKLKECINYNDIDLEGVIGFSITRDDKGTMKIVQAGDYTYDRGAFCDMY